MTLADLSPFERDLAGRTPDGSRPVLRERPAGTSEALAPHPGVDLQAGPEVQSRPEAQSRSELRRPRVRAATEVVRNFRPDIEGLRALAVVLVVLYHAGVPYLPGGYVGVDVFFVISGYLITKHLLGELQATGRISLVGFYARRAKRLLPLAGLVVLLTLAGSYFLTSALETRELATDVLWAGLFAMNVHLARDGVDYQAGTDPSPLQHFWSLAIEEQFYVVWPLVLFLGSLVWIKRSRAAARSSSSARSSSARRARVQDRRVSTPLLTMVVGSVAAGSLYYCIHQTQVAQSLAYFATPARAWELAIGGLIAINATALARMRWLQQDWLVLLGLAVIIGSAVTLTDTSVFPGYLALLPVLGCAAVLLAGLNRPGLIERRVLSLPMVQGLGKISYGLYLWHWPMLVLAKSYFDTDELSLVQALGVVVIALWLSTISFFAVEDPVRVMAGLRRAGRALALGGVVTATVCGVALAASTWIPDPRTTGDFVEPITDTAKLAAAITTSASLTDIPSNVEPTLAEAGDDKPSPTTGDGISCMVDLLDVEVSRRSTGTCVYGDPDGDKTVVLTGDSHAYHWLPAMEEMAVKRHWKLINLTKSGCPMYDVATINTILKRDYTECYTWRERVQERIATENPDTIITSAFTGSPDRDATFTPRWIAGMKSTITKFKATGARVIVLGDTPYPAQDIPKCLATNVDDASACATVRTKAASDPARRIQGARTAMALGVRYIDTLPWFCTQLTCPAVIGNTIVYSDNSHMTATYSRLLEPKLESAILS